MKIWLNFNRHVEATNPWNWNKPVESGAWRPPVAAAMTPKCKRDRVPFLNAQGNDISRSLLEFTNGKLIKTEEDLSWLKIHGANMFGIKQINYPKGHPKWRG